MLQSVLYVFFAYLTRMRDCEVQGMGAGCLEARRSEHGVMKRYRVKSTTYKRRGVRGQSEAWTTIESVAKELHYGECTAGVRSLGGKVERVAADQTQRYLDKEVTVSAEWLAQQGLPVS